MQRFTRLTKWIVVPCLAIAPVVAALISVERWSFQFPRSIVRNSPQSEVFRPDLFDLSSTSKYDSGEITETESFQNSVLLSSTQSTLSAQAFNCDDPQLQNEMNYCALLDYQEADEKLNRTYNYLLAVIPNHLRSKLVASERAWIVYRDSTCEFERSQYEGGSIEELIFHSCMAQLTQEQNIRLETYLQDY